MPIPQPGEIWEVRRSLESPLEFSSQERQTLFSDAVQNFLAGNSQPRYVMIVKEPNIEVEEHWLVVDVMLLSVETEFLSNVDLLIPAEISGLSQDLLAETWHIIPALTCNLLQSHGKRLSREIYDHLLTIGDYYYRLVDELPAILKTQSLGLISGNIDAAKDSTSQNFHQQEETWSEVLTLPVAAYYTYLDSIKLTNRVLNEALNLEQD
ncbi:hypothetical protein [Nostoc sp. TCL26-01]|uniref:hypothetical protein n=1 Tax=Nostoc sp. TCL26-01 TaxID=2576904 RepID=UPI0015B9CC95|nr:hypothetical protein [Nostoc sp. TCL26-01]QLE56767.1 hypothetical protein FD725_15385 [Nostoc sp. TCL26-01]